MTEPNDLPDSPEVVFMEHLKNGEFWIQRCAGCAALVFYPRVCCPHCGASSLNWEAYAGSPTVYSATTVRRRPDRGGDYNVSIVDLGDHARMMSTVVSVPPADVRIGMPVVASVGAHEAGPRVVFHPAVPR